MRGKIHTLALVLLLGLVLGIGSGCASMQEKAGPWVKVGMGALGVFSVSTSELNLGPVGFTYGITGGQIHGGFTIGSVPLTCFLLGVVPQMKAFVCEEPAVMEDGTAHHAPWSLPVPVAVPVVTDRPPNAEVRASIVPYKRSWGDGVT